MERGPAREGNTVAQFFRRRSFRGRHGSKVQIESKAYRTRTSWPVRTANNGQGEKGITKMKTEKFSGTITTAYGKALPQELKFEGTFEAFENESEAIEKNEGLTEAERLDVINNKRKANARAKVTAATLEAAGVSKPDPNSPEVLRESMVVNYMKLSKVDREAAEKIVAGLLG